MNLGDAIRNAANLVADYGSANIAIGALEGRYGKGLYERSWRRIAGEVPTYADEQVVVQHLLRDQERSS